MKVRPSVKPMCEKCKIRSFAETAKLWSFVPTLSISRDRVKTFDGLSYVRN